MEIIRSEDRGFFNHDWLVTYHTFSFAGYYNPNRINFGMLRVFNDDEIAGQMGFDTHPHDNMEIITIPIAGKLRHKDSSGEGGVLEAGDVQVMSAGTGITHSESNPGDETLRLFQIWIFPERINLAPRYEQKKFENPGWNTIQLLVSPDSKEGSLRIFQKAFLSRLSLQQGRGFIYESYRPDNGVFVFQVEGESTLNNQELHRRDTVLLDPMESVIINAVSDSSFIFIEVPMD
ncbi:MAG: pirin family protein [Bacteroidales bacterium]|nr:pirin family protein [Bacteroidales bacterium]